MANGFKTPLGCYVVAGLMGLPLWVWVRHLMPGSWLASPLIGGALLPGRLAGACVEAWVVIHHLASILEQDVQTLQVQLKGPQQRTRESDVN